MYLRRPCSHRDAALIRYHADSDATRHEEASKAIIFTLSGPAIGTLAMSSLESGGLA